MQAAALRLELRFPEAQSLKEKRRILKPLKEGLHNTLSISLAEVDHQDDWQRATLGMAIVARDGAKLDRLIDRMSGYVDKNSEIEVIDLRISYLEDPV